MKGENAFPDAAMKNDAVKFLSKLNNARQVEAVSSVDAGDLIPCIDSDNCKIKHFGFRLEPDVNHVEDVRMCNFQR